MKVEGWGIDGRKYTFRGNWQVKLDSQDEPITGKDQCWSVIVKRFSDSRINIFAWVYGVENPSQYQTGEKAQLMLFEDGTTLGAIGEVGCPSENESGGLAFEIKEIVGGNFSNFVLSALLKPFRLDNI